MEERLRPFVFVVSREVVHDNAVSTGKDELVVFALGLLLLPFGSKEQGVLEFAAIVRYVFDGYDILQAVLFHGVTFFK